MKDGVAKSVTLEDLAKATGFAISTVSRALRDDPSVNEATRKRVQDVAQRLGYDFERLRSGVASRGIKQVRFIVSSETDRTRARPGAHDEIIAGLRRFVEETRGEIIVTGADTTMTKADLQRCTGAIFVMPDERSRVFEKCVSAEIPIAVVCRNFPEARLCVRPDNDELMRMAFDHLTALGHTRLAFAGHDPRNLAMQERVQAIESLCAERCVDLTVLWFSGNMAADLEMIRRLRSSKEWPSGWICGSDHVAADLLRHCNEERIAVPDEAAIVGVGNLDLCEWTYPPLTSIAVQHEEMGYWSAKMLATYAPEIPGRVDVVFKSSLVVRRSCGADRSPGVPGT